MLGIDVGKRRHVATLLDAQGQTVFRNYGFAQSRDGVEGLLGRLAEAEVSPDELVVGLEATGHYWQILFEALVKAGWAVVVLNSLLTSARAGI